MGLARGPAGSYRDRSNSPDKVGRRARKTQNKMKELRAQVADLKKNRRKERSETPRQRSRTPRRDPIKDNRRPDVRPKKVPDFEWKAMLKVKSEPKGKNGCRFWNSSIGCSNESGCRYSHHCLLCGGDHKYVDRHLKKK